MPLLTITNLQTSPIILQDPTGLSGLTLTVPGSGAITGKPVSLAALASIEGQLAAETTAGILTWFVSDDPASQADSVPAKLITATVTPYTAAATDRNILCNRTASGAMSVVLSASAAIGTEVCVVDQKGDAATNNITITVASGTINGGANSVISANNGARRFLKRAATAWIVIS